MCVSSKADLWSILLLYVLKPITHHVEKLKLWPFAATEVIKIIAIPRNNGVMYTVQSKVCTTISLQHDTKYLSWYEIANLIPNTNVTVEISYDKNVSSQSSKELG